MNHKPHTFARRRLLKAGSIWLGGQWLGTAARAADTAPVSIVYDGAFGTWTLRNEVFQAVLRMNRGTGALQLDELRLFSTNEVWRLAAGGSSFPVAVELEDGRRIGAGTVFLLTGQSVQELARGGQALAIELVEESGAFGVTLQFQIYPGQPILRHQATLTARLLPAVIRKANFLAWEFAADPVAHDAFAVHQWVRVPREANFDPVQATLVAEGPAFSLFTGSGGSYCAWLAVRDARQRGILAGLEFNGRADFSARQAGDRLTLAAEVRTLNHALKPGVPFVLPAAFTGVFHGDWDEAGYRTQRYVEAAIAPPPPDTRFPYVSWDSWGYLEEIDEGTLRQNAKLAADLGIELFVVDLGWAARLGDWVADAEKFPSGLRALSDYVHELGMKFGLHFAFSEADPESAVLTANPDWTSSETYNFHGGESLCLGHQPMRDWIIEQGVNLVRTYKVDWLLQDGQTLVKECTKSTHTHHPEDSNWANSEEGLDVIVNEIRARTGVLFENCANGGSMMTFKMAGSYVTSITNDASGSLGSRQGVYGATFPFPPRFADRYMPDDHLDEYTTRSFMFGGPWVFMNRLPELSAQDLALAASEIQIYKKLRAGVREGRVSHLTGRPAAGRIDAMQSYDASRMTGVAIVTRENASENSFLLVWRDLAAKQLYLVRFETARNRSMMSGEQLMTKGIPVSLPAKLSAEIVYLEPAG